MNSDQQILSGLGKSTKRGIKKCFRCGVYNGARSTMCKNKECGVILKDFEEKSKFDLDAIKILTGTEKQVYSVRVRDMGPDYRGFVQLPLLQSHFEKDANYFSEVALCFVQSCQNSFDNSILKCHEQDQNDNNLFCVHIKSALKSQSRAAPIKLKNDILENLQIADDVKENLLMLATSKEGFLVQRVSKSIMAIKCQVSPKHPLGYLHFTFVRGKGKDYYEIYYCSCTEFNVFGSVREKANHKRGKCIHYYACIWALASDPKYCDEFAYFISNELSLIDNAPIDVVLKKVNSKECKNQLHSIIQSTAEKSCRKLKGNIKDLKCIKKKPRKKESIKKCQRLMPKILPVEIKVLDNMPSNMEIVSWIFIDWLSFVTESINTTMHFGNCGILNTLVFQIPENFYNCFTKRIPILYEVTKTEITTSYNIMNILHVKQIFDTPQIKLKISKKFVHNEQKGYVEYDGNEVNSETYQCPFIFFLNVGQSTVDESDNTNNSFVIEWLPSVTTLTNIGQIKFKYKYGRKST